MSAQRRASAARPLPRRFRCGSGDFRLADWFGSFPRIACRSKQTSKPMSRTDARSADGAVASSATAAYLHGKPRSGPLRYTPGFLYILALFVAGKFIFADPRATLVQWGEYHLSWVEVLLVVAAMMAMAEQLRVSHPGVDNTIEAILMGAVAGAQVLLFALGAAGVKPLAIFNNTEFLMLTVISMTQAIVAILINARTLRRTIGVGGNG
jgi:hypothetical protein